MSVSPLIDGWGVWGEGWGVGWQYLILPAFIFCITLNFGSFISISSFGTYVF